MSDVGRPEFVPTAADRAMVSGMAALGIRQELICSRLISPQTGAAIDRKTLRRAFRRELAAGMAEATAMVANALYQAALSGNVGAQTFWLTNRDPANWRLRTETLHGGVKDSPIIIAPGSPEANI